MRKKFPQLQKMILFIGDILIVAISAYVALLVVVAYTDVNLDIELYQRMLPIMLSVVGILLIFDGLLSLKRKKYIEVFIDLAIVMAKLFIIMMAISFFLREFAYSRSILIFAVMLQFIGLSFWNRLFWQFEYNQMIARRVLLMGTANENEHLLLQLRTHAYLKDHVKYICPDYDSGEWKKIINDTDLVILSPEMQLSHKSAMMRYCQTNKKQVFIMPSFYEVYCSKVDLDKIDDIPIFRPRYLTTTTEQRIMKRILDLLLASTGIILLLPLFILVAIAIKIGSPGPVIFSQKRVGEYEKEFNMYKFRTMCVDAEKQTGPVLAVAKDPRITSVGGFLRATRVDELPQLVNVLIGNMSIVGPRPERAFFVEKLKIELPEYVNRSNVKPGITGMAQVYGNYSTSPHNKLVYDLIYIQECNILTDLVLIMKTVRVLFFPKHAE